MRLATFRRTDEPDGGRRTGLVVGDGASWWIHPFPDGTDLVELLAADAADREAAADEAAQVDGLQPDQVVLLPPVYPVAMRDFLTFEAHVDGMERGHGNPGPPAEWYDAPVFLFMAPHAVTGPYDDVALPPDTERFDFELEIAAIVCRDVRNVTPGEARTAIGGYCVMNDWSARDVQGKEMKLKLGPSKGKDFATTIGPWGVHADELDGCPGAGGRVSRLPQRRRLPLPHDDGQGQRPRGRVGPLQPHGLVVRAARVALLTCLVGQGGRGSRVRHVCLWLAGRVVGPDRHPHPAPVGGGRRRGDDHRAAGHHPQHDRGRCRGGVAGRACPPPGAARGLGGAGTPTQHTPPP